MLPSVIYGVKDFQEVKLMRRLGFVSLVWPFYFKLRMKCEQ